MAKPLGNYCQVCGEEHDLPTPHNDKREVTLTLSNPLAHRMAEYACRANEWALVEALVHALSTGEAAKVEERV